MSRKNSESPAIDLKELVDECASGHRAPLLIRFPHILKGRVVELNELSSAITEYGYRAPTAASPDQCHQDRSWSRSW